MSVANRIEQLEQAIAAEQACGLPPETFRKVLAVVQRDEVAIALLRQAALVEDSRRWWAPPDAGHEFNDIVDRLRVKELAASDQQEAAKRLRTEAHQRLRLLIVGEFGEQIAAQVFAENESENAAQK